jgi:hypothetical protein
MRKETDSQKLINRIMSLVQNLTDERKTTLLELLVEWQQKENRHHPRIPCNFPVDFANQRRVYQDFIQDLSKGGVFIETREPIKIGEPISLTFSMPKSHAHFKMRGKIVRNENNGVAIEFDTKLSDYQEEVIMKSYDIKY